MCSSDMKSRSCLLCRKSTSDKKFDHTNLKREPKSNKSRTNLREFRRIRFGRKQRTLSAGLEHFYPFFIRRDKDSKEIEFYTINGIFAFGFTIVHVLSTIDWLSFDILARWLFTYISIREAYKGTFHNFAPKLYWNFTEKRVFYYKTSSPACPRITLTAQD